MRNSNTKVNILNVLIDNVSMSEVLTQLCEMVESETFSYVVTPNVDHLMKVQKDSIFRGIYNGASLVVPDGVPLLWASNILGIPLKERINGTDLFIRLCEVSTAKGYSIFLLGGDKGVAQKACDMLKKKFPGINIAGFYCPEFGFDKDTNECHRIQKMILASNAEILFVGLGAPKQEKWISFYGPGTNVKLAIGVGVSFSFISGDLKRAPLWMQRCGLEWFWRLLSEPRRLWRRYIIEDMPFFWLIGKAWLRRYFRKTNP